MGYMKNLEIRIRAGGDDAIAAACEMSDLVDERRGYENTMNSTGDISDIVTVLRGVGFSTISPQAGDSASLLHYCVTHAADEIERLRLTNDERMAIAYGVASLQAEGNYEISAKDTLRRLLERTATHMKGERSTY